jgi:lipopolysaccharide/colanic/teichoic acid biosynthesis glycosyltransferase/1-aminocyclopropane-1-carboxylate deaminase/D-cysteine desulfhydrase-like pyridoxal-dependent ACC family enzyme
MMYKNFFKRFFDFWISLVALVCISPILLVVTIWLHFANKGAGAFFFQQRPGRNGKIIKVIKYKTMTDERDADGNLLPDAQRLTKVGRIVRSTSIDELPQLINVLKGDMALIGPRPLLVKYLPYYSEREQLRHTVRPGITGWAQVHGRNHVLWEERFEYDAYYVEHLSLMMDLRIIFMTIKNVLQRKDIEVAPNLMDFDEYRRQQQAGRVFLRVEDAIIDNQPIKVVREDVFPIFGGGTKARKAVDYERYLRENGYNAVVTCGGVHSNHNRAIALMAMANGWKCHLVYHGSKNEFRKGKGNAGLVMMSGVETEFVDVDGISNAMDKAMARFEAQGLKPYYIHGGGHDLPGGTAFVDAIKELKHQCDDAGYKPDLIFHATGTGSTQAGIAVGLDLVGWSDVKLIGISVARNEERGKKVVVDFANELAKHYGISKDYSDTIAFDDNYVGSGYDKRNKEVESFIKNVRQGTSLLVDETYSGKAMYGMMDYIKKNKLKGSFLFWLSGGPLNAIN